jgi:hypothetical protein
MISLPIYGKYLLHYKVNENVWIMEYLGPDEEKPDVAPPCSVSLVPYSDNIYVTELIAVDPVSAFTRAANAIIDKIKERT